jgi:regulator of replication initiation timing
MAFENANLPALFDARQKLEMEIAAARQATEETLAPKLALLLEINGDISKLAVPMAQATYKREEKVDGTVKFASGDRIFKSVITKSVGYDQDKLFAIANSIPWQQAQQVFKIKLDVSETTFKKLEDEDLKKRLTEARTVKYGEPKITLED